MTPNRVNSLYLFINSANEYILKSNGNNDLKPVPTYESKHKLQSLKKHEAKLNILLHQSITS